MQSEDEEKPSPPATGYGHAAHKPDPQATYTFEPGPPRTLPVEARKRWKVSG